MDSAVRRRMKQHNTLNSKPSILAVLTLALCTPFAGCAEDGTLPVEETPVSDSVVSDSVVSDTSAPPGARLVDMDPALFLDGGFAQLPKDTNKSIQVVCLVHDVAMKALTSGLFVAVDRGDGNRLKVWSQNAAEWERFKMCKFDQSYDVQLALWSVDARRWVSAEYAWSGDGWAQLRARATEVSTWETFNYKVVTPGTGIYTLSVPTGNGNEQYWVRPEYDWGPSHQEVRASGTWSGQAEQFQMLNMYYPG